MQNAREGGMLEEGRGELSELNRPRARLLASLSPEKQKSIIFQGEDRLPSYLWTESSDHSSQQRGFLIRRACADFLPSLPSPSGRSNRSSTSSRK